jgi:lipopolysaccharide transport system ATP-binding protein
MSRKEIKSKFDEIVNFADLDHFIDTPVKRYSSGMYVRLAFGVAAHLEPEILIIDEVLAVGDANFQKKCLGKMREVSKKDGRTVLFVSHNMAAIHHLCPRAILMQNGQLAEDGPSESVVTAYLNGMRLPQDNNAHIKSFDGNFSISHTILRNKAGNETNTFKPGETLEVEIHYDSKKTILAPFCWVSLSGSEGVLLGANMLLDGFRPTQMQGKGFIKVRFTNLPLLPQNSYFVHAGMRYNDAKTPIIPSGEIAHFNVTGSALESGFLSPNADTFLLKASGIIAEYEWELSTGEKFAFKPTFKN